MGDRPHIRFLYTGGTLGMEHAEHGTLAPSAAGEDVVGWVPGLEQEVEVEGRLLCNLDSSDLGPPQWERIAEVVAEERKEYDGFVVIHGTDTMAYTACALSFMLRGLDRPVVITGAQRPIAMVRTDARSNVIHSALCAGMPIPEVCIFFGRHLFRGNRVTKTSIQSYDAMESPNMGALMEMGVEMEQRVWPLTPRVPFKLARGFERRVGAFQVVPGSGPELLDAAVAAGLQGVVLRGFGAGNLPQAGWPEGIDRAVRAGVAVVIQSQCLRGTVDLGRYKGGEAAMAAGAVPSGSLTSEATVVKLMYLLGQGHRGPVFRRQWQVDLAGEM